MEVLEDVTADVPASESLIGLYHIDNQLFEDYLHRHIYHELVTIVRGSGKSELDLMRATSLLVQWLSSRPVQTTLGDRIVRMLKCRRYFSTSLNRSSPHLFVNYRKPLVCEPLFQRIGQGRFAAFPSLTGFVLDCGQSKELADFCV